jgi:hypothetical protein
VQWEFKNQKFRMDIFECMFSFLKNHFFSRPDSSSAMMTTNPTIPSKDYIKFVQPCLQSLVGMRGLLLHTQRLKEIGFPNLVEGSSPDNLNILKTGIQHPMFFGFRGSSNAHVESTMVSGDDRLSAQEADRRLRDRFVSLFFWPAQMSITP